MINIKGDLTTLEKGFILHQVNCKNRMGAGFAKNLYLKFPMIKSEYHTFCKGKTSKELLGSLQIVKVTEDLTILNSFSQENFYKKGDKKQVYTDVDILVENIELGALLADQAGSSLYIPEKIGCGLGGACWDEVLAKIDGFNIVVVTYEKGGRLQ